jgi:hypothetical protein
MQAEGRDRVDRADLLKQRRLLLGFTFVLAAIHGLDVDVGSSVTVQGIVLSFKHAWLLVVALWIAWIWAVWRYWQYERSFSSAALEGDRHRLRSQRARQAVQNGIYAAAQRGDYADRGLGPRQGFTVSDSGPGPLTAPRDDRLEEWTWTNLQVAIGQPDPGMPLTLLKGGANFRLEKAEVSAIKRSVDAELLLKHPHFADWKAPYLLMWLAPLAGLVALVRYVAATWAWC